MVQEDIKIFIYSWDSLYLLSQSPHFDCIFKSHLLYKKFVDASLKPLWRQPVQSWPIQDDNSCGPGCKRDIPPPPTHQAPRIGRASARGFCAENLDISDKQENLWKIHCQRLLRHSNNIPIVANILTEHSPFEMSSYPNSWKQMPSEVWHCSIWGLTPGSLRGGASPTVPSFFSMRRNTPRNLKKHQGFPCGWIIASSGTRTPCRTTNVLDWEIIYVYRCDKLIDLKMSCLLYILSVHIYIYI